MAQVIKSLSHKNCHSVVNSMLDLNLLVKLLVEDAVFKYHPSQRTNMIKFINLYIRRLRVIIARGSLNAY